MRAGLYVTWFAIIFAAQTDFSDGTDWMKKHEICQQAYITWLLRSLILKGNVRSSKEALYWLIGYHKQYKYLIY